MGKRRGKPDKIVHQVTLNMLSNVFDLWEWITRRHTLAGARTHARAHDTRRHAREQQIQIMEYVTLAQACASMRESECVSARMVRR
jgi:hypothetical protein